MKRPINTVVMVVLAMYLALRVAAIARDGFRWSHVLWAAAYAFALVLAVLWELYGRHANAPVAPATPKSAFPVVTGGGDRAGANADAGGSAGADVNAVADAEAKRPLVSLVLLLRDPVPLADADARDALARAFPGPADAVALARVSATNLAFTVGGRAFVIVDAPVPYVKDRDAEAAAAITPELAGAIRAHGAWRAVDLVEDDDAPPADEAGAYRVIGAALAELARGADVLAVFSPQDGRMAEWRPELADVLRGADPRAALLA